jgi:hypothetical protein
MSWFRVDDKFAFHPKAIRAGNEAVGVWVRVGSWSSDQMTDGAIPGDVALVIANGNQSVLDQLVTAGLLVRDGLGYHMHDFLDWNPSAKQVKRQRKADAERKRGIRPPSGKTPAGLRPESSSPIPSPIPIPIPVREEDQTPLPPRGVGVSVGEMADPSAPDSQPPLPGLDPPKRGTAAIEETIFRAYLDGRHRAGVKGRDPVLDDKRRRMIRGRLADGFTVEDMIAAARGIWRSDWHVGERRTEFDLVVRDAKQVERFRDLVPPAGVPAGAPPFSMSGIREEDRVYRDPPVKQTAEDIERGRRGIAAALAGAK